MGGTRGVRCHDPGCDQQRCRQCRGRYDRGRGYGLDRRHERSRRLPVRGLERDGDPRQHLDHCRLLRQDRRAKLARAAGAAPLGRAARPARDAAVDAGGRDLDVRGQRGDHPDDGAGGVAAGAGAAHSDYTAHPHDRFQRQFHGNRAAAGRPAAADVTQRVRCGVRGFHLAIRPAVLVSDSHGDLRDYPRRHVRVWLPRHRASRGVGRGRWDRSQNPGPAVRHARGGVVPAHGGGNGFPGGAADEAGVHRAHRCRDAGAVAGIARQAGEGAEVRGDHSGTRLACDLLLHRAVRPRGRARKDETPRVACPRADAHLSGEPGAGRHAALLGHRSHRRAGRA